MERHFCKDKALEEKFGVIHEQVCGGNASALLPTSSLLEAHLDHAKSIGCTFVNGASQIKWRSTMSLLKYLFRRFTHTCTMLGYSMVTGSLLLL